MPARVVPTLAAMAEVYRLPREGGASSPLFRRCLGPIDDDAPLQPCTSMAGAVTGPTIEEAEDRLRRRRMGSPGTVRPAFDQEGWVHAVAGAPDPSPTPATQRAVYDALAVVGDDAGLDVMVALMYGDEAADRLGRRSLGLPDRSGYAVGLHHYLQRRDQLDGSTTEVRRKRDDPR